jgi:DNA excision repair protein ERCC-3
MSDRSGRPIIVQSDGSVLLDLAAADAGEARDALSRFAELVKSPEHVHTYRLGRLSLWNAASAGVTEAQVLGDLERFGRYPVPRNVASEIREAMGRYGRLVLERTSDGGGLVLRATDDLAARHVASLARVQPLLGPRDGVVFAVPPLARGTLKQALVHAGWPVDDRAGFADGTPLAFSFLARSRAGRPFALRDYQEDACRAFLAGGHGVVVLPCGAGKTVVALGAMAALGTHTLILCTSVSAVHQWVREIRDKTTLAPDAVGEYTATSKQVRPITVTTYSMLVRKQGGGLPHLALFDRGSWGLIVYDEVHMLPAPMFRVTADLQARRRLGLTATLIREDGKEADVFSLVGPKRYDVPWRQMEASGWVARARCVEVRVPATNAVRIASASAESAAESYRIAAENPRKLALVRALVDGHPNDRILVVGQYLEQVSAAARVLDAPVITGATGDVERERLYAGFRAGEIRVLVASKVANFSIDLPDASVLVQMSGAFGSRQEEAQRLGRILRPKERLATFYTLVTPDSPEQEFALHRQMFLAEQGYGYEVEDWVPATGVEEIEVLAPSRSALAPTEKEPPV